MCALHRAFAPATPMSSYNSTSPLTILRHTFRSYQQHYNGSFFCRSSLAALGAVVQLGHFNSPCPNPSLNTRSMVVCTESGIHRITARFCECTDGEDGLVPPWQQCMRAGWFPATTGRPTTVCTFRCLDAFHELNLEGKVNVNDYYQSLERITDNSGGLSGLVSHE